MQRLILVRHAEAQSRGPGQRDIERPLTTRGSHDAAALGRALAQAGLQPDRALVSSALRTRQTWEAAQPALGAVHLRLEPQLYDAAAGDIAKLVGEASGRTLMVVAHNPGIALYAAHLAELSGDPGAGDAIRRGFPPATAAVFTVSDERPVFERLLLAEDYGAQA